MLEVCHSLPDLTGPVLVEVGANLVAVPGQGDQVSLLLRDVLRDKFIVLFTAYRY